jgi:hypothetical protein
MGPVLHFRTIRLQSRGFKQINMAKSKLRQQVSRGVSENETMVNESMVSHGLSSVCEPVIYAVWLTHGTLRCVSRSSMWGGHGRRARGHEEWPVGRAGRNGGKRGRR